MWKRERERERVWKRERERERQMAEKREWESLARGRGRDGDKKGKRERYLHMKQ